MFIDGIVGAPPNMMKMAPLARALAADGTFRLRLVHTGQHYDETLSQVFFRDLGLPMPDINLDVGSGTQGEQTASIRRLLTEHGCRYQYSHSRIHRCLKGYSYREKENGLEIL